MAWLLLAVCGFIAFALQVNVFTKEVRLARLVAAVGIAFVAEQVFFVVVGAGHPVRGAAVGVVYSLTVIAGCIAWDGLAPYTPAPPTKDELEAVGAPDDLYDNEPKAPAKGTPLAGWATFMFLSVIVAFWFPEVGDALRSMRDYDTVDNSRD